MSDEDYAHDWIERPDELRKRVEQNPSTIEQEFRALDQAHEHRAYSLVNRDAMMFALIEPSRRKIIVAATPDSEPLNATQFDWELAESVLRRGAADFLSDAFLSDDGPAWVYAPARGAVAWDLPESIQRAVEVSSGDVVLAVAPSLSAPTPLQGACDAFSLTSLESRVVIETLRAGNIRDGAQRAGVSYSTAREAISHALTKAGAPRLPGLVYRLSLLALGVFPNSQDASTLLADRWGLSPRQAQIALLLAEGLTRAQSARALGLSEASVKKETDIIFRTLGASTSAEAARMVSAVTTLQTLLEASQGRLVWTDQTVEPLRLIRRPDGSRIAISDFGPRGGRPVLLVHACFSGRHPPRGFVRALIQAGYRPIAIDRPGYGLTDFTGAIDLHPDREPFGAAAHDMALVLDALGLADADVIGRGGAQGALAFAALYPQRCGRVLLITPIPPTFCDVGWRGLFAAYRELYRLKPDLIPHSIRLMARLMSRKFIASFVRSGLANTPPDLRYTSSPGFDDDYYRTMQMYALGNLDGYIHEQAYVIREASDGYAPDSSKFLVLYGEYDAVTEPELSRGYWQERLPHARFEKVAGEGRLLDYGLPDFVVDRLRTMS